MQATPSPSTGVSKPTEAATAPGQGRVVLFSMAALVAGAAATYWVEQVRYERLPALLQARQQTITATCDARVAKILVPPGTIVEAGTPLVELTDQTLAELVALHQREVETLEIELARTRAQLEVTLESERREILDRIFEARWRAAQTLRSQLAPPGYGDKPGSVLDAREALPPVVQAEHRSGVIFGRDAQGSPVPVRRLPDSAFVPRNVSLAELELYAERITELEELNRELPEKIARSMGVKLAEARLSHARAALAAVESRRRELLLVAETPGMVGVYHKEVGDRVIAQEPIVQVLDEEQPYLLLQIPSPRIADFAPGTLVELRFPGGVKGKGRVEEIPPQAAPISAEGGPIETVISAHIDRVGALWPSLPFGSVVEVRRRR